MNRNGVIMTNVDNLLGGVPKDMDDLDGIVKWYKSIKACKEFKDNADIVGGVYLGLAHSELVVNRQPYIKQMVEHLKSVQDNKVGV